MEDIVRDTVSLWKNIHPYSGYKIETIDWRLIPAIENKKIKVYYRGKKCVGFITWAWFTEEEFDTLDYNGAEVFKRNEGDMLYVVDLIIPYGRSDVTHIVRDMRRYLSELHPDKPMAFAHRSGFRKQWANRSI
jgi:hemolysin-activating ACP:hemolysin acyltransferase|tara:strand:+ start:64 stop:462 length:399 start_codon:yes stop_codon:yes gene_type:complete